MGCDIHGYIEYKAFDTKEGEPYYDTFAKNIGDRDYAMFGLLANVRRGGCLFEPKGLPENLSFSTKYEYCMFVTDDGEGDGCVTKEQARKWIAAGISKPMGGDFISHPDWHTPSWLNVDEYEQVLVSRKSITDYGNVDPTWDAVLAAMKVLPMARFVFWFDN